MNIHVSLSLNIDQGSMMVLLHLMNLAHSMLS